MRVNFTAAEHGFAFANSFTNHVVRIPALGIDITTKGRCGGMAAAALDHWHAGLAMPESSYLRQDGSLVGDYVYSRLIDTMIDNGAKFVHYATSLDHPTWLRGKGVSRMVREDQLPLLKARLDAGQPQLLGLTQARSVTELGNDHQVVAYGYREDARYTYVYVWDNRTPGREVTLKLTTSDDPNERQITGAGTWRGLFVGSYSRKRPSYLAEGRLIHDSTDPRIFVVRGGGAFWIPSGAEFDACGFSWSASSRPSPARCVTSPPTRATATSSASAAPRRSTSSTAAAPSGSRRRRSSRRSASTGRASSTCPRVRSADCARCRASRPCCASAPPTRCGSSGAGLSRHVTSQAVMDAYGLEWRACGSSPTARWQPSRKMRR